MRAEVDFKLHADFQSSRITRYLGCVTAYGVFIWRYLNVPENWPYVNSWWSWIIIFLTMLPETIWPVVYIRVYTLGKHRAQASKQEAKKLR